MFTSTKGFTHSSASISTPDKYKSDSTPVRMGIGYSILHESFMKTPIAPPLSSQTPFSFSLSLISSVRQQLSIFAKRFSQSLVLLGESLPRMRQRRRAREAALMRCPQRCACTCAKGSRCSNPLPGDTVHGISSATWGQAEPDLLHQREPLNHLLLYTVIICKAISAFTPLQELLSTAPEYEDCSLCSCRFCAAF